MHEMARWIAENEIIPDSPEEIKKIFTVQVTARVCNVSVDRVVKEIIKITKGERNVDTTSPAHT